MCFNYNTCSFRDLIWYIQYVILPVQFLVYDNAQKLRCCNIFLNFYTQLRITFFRVNSMLWVLSIFNVNLFTFNHLTITLNSLLNILSISFRLSPSCDKFESSAINIDIVNFHTSAKSFIYILKITRVPRLTLEARHSWYSLVQICHCYMLQTVCDLLNNY